MTLSDDPRDLARAALEPGEKLVWAGRPGVAALPGWRLDVKSLWNTLVAFLTGLLFLWLVVRLVSEGLGALFFLIAGALALGIAAWGASAPLRAARAVRRTVYAVTDRRLIILKPSPRRTLQSFMPEEIENPVVHDRGGGRGDVVFGTIVAVKDSSKARRLKLMNAAFVDVEEPQRVAHEIEKLKLRATRNYVVARSRT